MFIPLIRRFFLGVVWALAFLQLHGYLQTKRRRMLTLLFAGAGYCAAVTLGSRRFPETAFALLLVCAVALLDYCIHRFHSPLRALSIVIAYLITLAYYWVLLAIGVYPALLANWTRVPAGVYEGGSALLLPLFCRWRIHRHADRFGQMRALLSMGQSRKLLLCLFLQQTLLYILLSTPYSPQSRTLFLILLPGVAFSLAATHFLLNVGSAISEERRHAMHLEHQRQHDMESIEHRLRSMEQRALANARHDSAFDHELTVTRTEIQSIRRRDAAGLLQSPFPTTGLPLLDSQLKLCQQRCAAQGIELSLFVRADLHRLPSGQAISLEALRRVVGILTDNAFHALTRPPRMDGGVIHLSIGIVDGCYCLEVADNGPPFTAAVLQNIGAEGNTTGGNGFGIPDLLEAIDPCRASFIIEELSTSRPLLTKAITLRFDGRNRRIVYTGRPELLRLPRNPYGFLYTQKTKGC